MAGTIDVPSPVVLQEAGQREVAALAALLSATEPGQSVHGARRRIKQLRSLLRLLRAALGEETYGRANAALRAAADALAGHRRAEALVTAAAKLGEGPEHGNGFWHGLAEAHRAAHAADGNPGEALDTARRAIADADRELSVALREDPGADAVVAAFLESYRKARKLLRRGLESGDPATLHEARKFVIHHLHQLKLVQPWRERRLAALEALREVLGDLNDLDEMEALAQGVAVPAREARRMRKARTRLHERAGRAAERLFRHKPAAFRKRMGHAAAPRSPHAGVALQGGE